HGREHLLHRRPDSTHRGGVAEDAQSRQEVTNRVQGRPFLARAVPGLASGKLAATRPEEQGQGKRARGGVSLGRSRSTFEAETCVTVKVVENWAVTAVIARRCTATWQTPWWSTRSFVPRCPRPRSCAAWS